MRGDEDFRHGSRLDPTQRGRDAREIAFRDDHKFRLATARSDTEDPVADFPGVRSFDTVVQNISGSRCSATLVTSSSSPSTRS